MKNSDELYQEVSALCGAALRRLARGYEADADRWRDLLQEIRLALWRRLRLPEGRCSLQTWVYRVAHNVGASYILRERRTARRLLDLEAFEQAPGLVEARRRQTGSFRCRSYSNEFTG